MSQPPTLEYRRPPQGDSRQRKQVSRHARMNGFVCVLLGMCCAGIVLPDLDPHSRVVLSSRGDHLTEALAALYFTSFLICGVLYIIGGIIIRRPHPPWEDAIACAAAIHMLVIAALLLRVVAIAHGGTGADTFFVLLILNLIVCLPLGIMLRGARNLRRQR